MFTLSVVFGQLRLTYKEGVLFIFFLYNALLPIECLAQMADLRRLFILLLRSHQSPYDMVYLRDLIHANNTYLLLLEDWVSQGYIPAPFSMLSHIKQ